MKKTNPLLLFRSLSIIALLFFVNGLFAQEQNNEPETPNNFWKNVQFGSGLGLGFSSGFSNISIAPSAIYNFNPKVALGAGVNFNYISAKNDYTSTVYGISTILLVNPLDQIQLSAELNQSRVNFKQTGISNLSENFWNPSLILGAGYRTGNVTFGVGYNVLKNNRYNTETLIPFVRAYF